MRKDFHVTCACPLCARGRHPAARNVELYFAQLLNRSVKAGGEGGEEAPDEEMATCEVPTREWKADTRSKQSWFKVASKERIRRT